MLQADRDACEEAVLKDTANRFALKKEISSRSFYNSVLYFLCCSGLQRALSRKPWQPTEKQCRWFWKKLIENSSFLWMSHVPLLITHPLQLSQSLPSLCLWSPWSISSSPPHICRTLSQAGNQDSCLFSCWRLSHSGQSSYFSLLYSALGLSKTTK